jgi:transketolase
VCKVHRAGPDDAAALIGAGVALHECLTAANQPAEDGINARVIDLYSINPSTRRPCTGRALKPGQDHRR